MPRDGRTQVTVDTETRDRLREWKGEATYDEAIMALLDMAEQTEDAQDYTGPVLTDRDVNRIREGVRREVREALVEVAGH